MRKMEKTQRLVANIRTTAYKPFLADYVYKPGDFVLLKTGTQHSSYSRTGAVLAVFIRSAEKNI